MSKLVATEVIGVYRLQEGKDILTVHNQEGVLVVNKGSYNKKIRSCNLNGILDLDGIEKILYVVDHCFAIPVFDDGDKVYFPSQSREILTIQDNRRISFTDKFDKKAEVFINRDGTCEGDNFQKVFHASDANKGLIDTLYGFEFEKIKFTLTGSDLCKHLLKNSNVFCGVSDHGDKEATDHGSLVALITHFNANQRFEDKNGEFHNFAVPIDMDFEPLVQEVEG